MHLTKYSKLIYTLSFVLIHFLFVVPNKVLATDYYVAGDTGLDTNNGSMSTPWKTIQKAADTMVAGDTVNVKGNITYSTGKNDCSFMGYFAATICLSRSGTADNYITFQPWEGTGVPVIIPSGGMFGSNGVSLLSGISVVNYIRIDGFLIKSSNAGITFGGIGNIIANNIFVNNGDYGTSISMGVNENDLTYIYNNTTYNSYTGIHINGGRAIIKNNVVINSSIGIQANNGYYVSMELDYNVVYGSTISDYNVGLLPIGNHSFSLDPRFADPTSDNFELSNDSPLIDAGETIDLVTSDITRDIRPKGNAFDIGAYETSYSQTNPPNLVGISLYVRPPNSLTQLAIFTGEPELTDGNSQFAFWNSFSTMAFGDVNSDGFDDFITGARHYDPKGGMYIFYGKNNLSDTDAANADVIYRSNTNGHGFAENISIEDIDNDGIKDILATNYGVSKAYFFRGGSLSSGEVTSATSVVTGANQFGFGSTILGDINGDGFKDYAIRDNGSPSKVYFFLGDGTITNKSSAEADFYITTGTNVVMLSRPGDVNNDGYDDILFGCPSWCGTNKIYLYYGRASGWTNKDYSEVDVIFTGVSGNTVGSWVNLADVNGDGFDDIISTGNDSIDVFYGKSQMTNKMANEADVIISASTQFMQLTLGKSAIGVDMNNDGYQDIVFSSPVGPKTYVVYGGPNLVSKNASQADLVFDAISAWGSYYGGPMETGDMNNDGYQDIGIGAGMYNMRQGRAYILTSPHGTPVITTTKVGWDSDNGVIEGSVTDSYPLGGIEFSFDGGGWNNCNLTSNNFNCSLPQSSAGSNHTVRVRYKNIYGVYIPEREYKVINFNFLTKSGPPGSRSCASVLNPNLTPIIINLKSLNNNTSVELTLVNNDTNATEYIIEYGTTKTNLNYSALNIPTTTKTYTINKLNPTKQYYFRVRTTNGCGFSNWSSLTLIKNENSEVKTKETPLHSATQNSAGQATPLPSVENQEANTEKQTLLQKIWVFILGLFS